MPNQTITEKLRTLPTEPGIYMMKSKTGKILYIGKAKSLRDRVQSYFRPSATLHGLTSVMIKHVTDLEVIITANPIEALVLENNLIKKHLPRYNIKLKDDSRYPYVKITIDEPFPQISITRDVAKDQAKYFGPFIKRRAVWKTVKTLTKIFPIRTCDLDLSESGNHHRPCLDYHIKRCSGPCADLVSIKDYRQSVSDAMRFLSGKTDEVIAELTDRMNVAATHLNFELAAKYRDSIKMIRDAVDEQNIDTPSATDEDVIGIQMYSDTFGDQNEACVQVLMIRDGKLNNREHYFLTDVDPDQRIEALTTFVQNYYENLEFIPKTIILPNEIDLPEEITKWLSEKRGDQVTLNIPKRGRKSQLIAMAERNAKLILDQRNFHIVAVGDANPALRDLQDLLGLPKIPQRIEGFDISNLGDRFAVASMVVMIDGEPTNSEYRRFKMRSVVGQNDFAMMQEVIDRRFRRAIQVRKFPDLILIDGGKGQLNATIELLKSLELSHLPIIGLAKKFEHIFLPNRSEPIALRRDNPTLHLIQRLRDEAHRFALAYHRKLRDASLKQSILDEIPLVGKKRKRALLKHFGTISAIRSATVEQLISLPIIDDRTAQNIVNFFQKI